jgi:hypothetical protein
MITLLIDQGIRIDELDDEKRTAFELALEQNAVNILPLLTANVSLSRTPQLLHRFHKKIFDDRYRAILKGLIEAEAGIGAETMNALNEKGFSPFLAYVEAFVKERSWLSQQISNALTHQEYLHGDKAARYKVANLDLFEPREPDTPEYRTWQNTRHNPGSKALRLDTEEFTKMKTKIFNELIVQPFIELLDFLVAKGADPSAKVEKLEFYRKLDTHKQHLQLVQGQRDGLHVAQDAVMQEEGQRMIDTTAAA